MSFNKRFFTTGGIVASSGVAGCTTDTTDVFGDTNGVALYTLDYDASDASGLYDGVPTNVEFGVGGQINYGAGFNGSSSYIDIDNISGISGASSEVSISTWFNFSGASGDRFIISLRDGCLAEIGFNSGYSPRKLEFKIFDGGNKTVLVDESLITNNNWHHIVLTAESGGLLTAYLDGVSQGTTSIGTISNVTQNNTIGGYNISGTVFGYFDGLIDQVRIFSKALNQTEVSTLYAETACVYTCTTDTVDYPTTNVAYYKLDNSAEDETGTYDGTATNVNYTFGRFGQAAVFNGSSSKITTSLDFDTLTDYTISMWIKIDVTPSATDFFAGTVSGASALNGFYIGNEPDNEIRFYERNASTTITVLKSTDTINVGSWNHIVAIRDGNTNYLYINNGTPVSVSNGSISHNENFTLGKAGSYGAGLFDGDIDQVRIFSSALTSTQVESLYNEKPCEDTSTFQTVLWDMDGVDGRYISNVGFEPDFVWIKDRDDTSVHVLFDSIRGATNYLSSSSTAAEASASTTLQSFEANGFTLGNSGTVNDSSGNGAVAWAWKAGGDSVLNQVGDIDSQVSANTAAGFSIVKWTGNNLASQTIGHGLSSTPEITIIKKLTGTALDWQVNLNSSITGTEGYLNLNLAVALYTTFPNYYTSANSTVLSTNGTTTAERQYNNQSADYIAYCFHSVAGYSKIGSYDGSGSTQSIYVTDDDTSTGSGGFQPSFVMIKNIDAAANWMMYDAVRDSDGNINLYLEANTSDNEASAATATISPISNGFTIGNSNSIHINDSTDTYIYMAFK